MLHTGLDSRPKLPVICGPTAVGKTALALELAEHFGGEIISADSRQVFRRMDVGTAKPSKEEQAKARHHLVDVVWPDEEFNASRFVELADVAIADVCGRSKKPLLVGGTGLYIKALTEGLLEAPGADPELRRQLHEKADLQGSAALHRELAAVDSVSAERLHPNDLIRIVRALEVFRQSGRTLSQLQEEHGFKSQPYRLLKLGLHLDRDVLYRRIEQRAETMFSSGLIEETESLLATGYDPGLKTLRTIGYRQALALLHGRMSLEEAVEDLKMTTRRYAKQQLTWFYKDKSIIWLESSADFVTIRELFDEFYDI